MDNIDLSIVVPLYNGKQYIKETVEELLKIECRKEILIIDDGSTDGSYEYCMKLWGDNSDIKLFTKQNSGIVDTRNFGLKNSNGQYLFFSDQDDISYPEVIDAAIKNAEDKCLDGVLWSTVRLLEKNQTVSCDTVYNDEIVTKTEITNSFIPRMLINSANEKVSYLGHVWAGIYRRDIVEKNNINFKRFVDIEDDYLFVFDFLIAANTLGLMHRTGYAWRFNQKSETYRLKYIDNILEKYIKFYRYLSQCVNGYKFSEQGLSKFLTYQIQNTLVMSIENSFTYLNKSKTDKREIKKYYLQNKKYFILNSVFEYEKRRKRIYLCLKHGMFCIAASYVYLDSMYRWLKNQIISCTMRLLLSIKKLMIAKNGD